MPRTVHLPVECWSEILQEAIFVPLFFDTDPLEHYPASMIRRYNDDAPYWESERIRNALRRVCSSWNKFLKRFDYRYVQSDHILSRGFPPEALRNAIRLSTAPCTCKLCITMFRSGRLQYGSSWSEIIAAAHEGAQGAWKVKILQIDHLYFSHTVEIMKLPARCKNLKVVFDYRDPRSLNDLPIQVLEPNLISAIQAGVPATFQTLDLSHLTTLYLRVTNMDGPGAISLPRLRHLSINFTYIRPRLADPRTLLQWPKAAGSRLVTLFWTGRAGDGDLLPEIWDLCPRLRHLQLPRGINWAPPPPGRSLDLFRLDSTVSAYVGAPVSACSICRRIHTPEQFQFTHCIPQLAVDSVASIAISMDWGSLLIKNPTRGGFNAAHCLKVRASSYGIKMLDALGYTFEEALVSWLEDKIAGKEATGIEAYKPQWLDF